MSASRCLSHSGSSSQSRSFKAFACSYGVHRSPHLRQLPSYLSVPRSHAICIASFPSPRKVCATPTSLRNRSSPCYTRWGLEVPLYASDFFCGQSLSTEAVSLCLLFRVSQSLSTLLFASCFNFGRNCCWPLGCHLETWFLLLSILEERYDEGVVPSKFVLRKHVESEK